MYFFKTVKSAPLHLFRTGMRAVWTFSGNTLYIFSHLFRLTFFSDGSMWWVSLGQGRQLADTGTHWALSPLSPHPDHFPQVTQHQSGQVISNFYNFLVLGLVLLCFLFSFFMVCVLLFLCSLFFLFLFLCLFLFLLWFSYYYFTCVVTLATK